MQGLLKKNKNILKSINTKNLFIRFSFFLFACFIYALAYDLFYVPNDIVVGGMSGLAIIVKQLTGMSTTTFLYLTTAIILIISYIFLGKGDVINTLIGSVTFTVLVSLTEPLVKLINIEFNNMFVVILVSSIMRGISNGIIFRTGFNTGGSDVIAEVVNKYFKLSVGKCNHIVNAIIIIIGTLTFGLTKTIYSVIILTISSNLIDVVMLGVNDSKMCYIKSKKWKKLKKIIINDYHIGVTEIGSKGGIFNKEDPTLFVIVPFDLYYGFKHSIITEDENAFIVVHDCYTVKGGYKKKFLPF